MFFFFLFLSSLLFFVFFPVIKGTHRVPHLFLHLLKIGKLLTMLFVQQKKKLNFSTSLLQQNILELSDYNSRNRMSEGENMFFIFCGEGGGIDLLFQFFQ